MGEPGRQLDGWSLPPDPRVLARVVSEVASYRRAYGPLADDLPHRMSKLKGVAGGKRTRLAVDLFHHMSKLKGVARNRLVCNNEASRRWAGA